MPHREPNRSKKDKRTPWQKSRKLLPIIDESEQVIGFGFHCPGCRGIHQAFITRPNKEGSQWTFPNQNMAEPTFEPAFERLERIPGKETVFCRCHVRDGLIHYVPECTHKLAGWSIGLPPAEHPELVYQFLDDPKLFEEAKNNKAYAKDSQLYVPSQYR